MNDYAPLQTKMPYPVDIYAIKNVNIFSIMDIKMIFIVLNLLFLLALILGLNMNIVTEVTSRV